MKHLSFKKYLIRQLLKLNRTMYMHNDFKKLVVRTTLKKFFNRTFFLRLLKMQFLQQRTTIFFNFLSAVQQGPHDNAAYFIRKIRIRNVLKRRKKGRSERRNINLSKKWLNKQVITMKRGLRKHKRSRF